MQQVLSTSQCYSRCGQCHQPLPQRRELSPAAPGYQRTYDVIRFRFCLGPEASHLKILKAGQLVLSVRPSIGEIWGSGREIPWIKIGGEKVQAPALALDPPQNKQSVSTATSLRKSSMAESAQGVRNAERASPRGRLARPKNSQSQNLGRQGAGILGSRPSLFIATLG